MKLRNTTLRKLLVLLLALTLLISGCSGGLFRKADKNTVALYRPGSLFATYVDRSEIEGAFFPRTHVYDELTEDVFPDLLEMLDYALSNGYTSVGYTLPLGKSVDWDTDFSFLQRIYPINQCTFSLSTDGKILDRDVPLERVQVTLNAGRETMDRFQQGLEEARRLVRLTPSGIREDRTTWSLDDFETARILYDYLTRNVTYDMTKENYYTHDWNLIYDALIEKKTVCAGIADALYYLYNLAGIDCTVIYGTGQREDGTTFLHEWNGATLCGAYYYFDATWDIVGYLLDSDYFFAVSKQTLCMDEPRSSDQQEWEWGAEEDLKLPDLWRYNPEYAIKSYLLLRSYRDDYPLALLRFGEFLRSDTEMTDRETGSFAVYDIPFAEFETWMEQYVTTSCFLTDFCKGAYRNRDGSLSASTKPGFAHAYTLKTVLENTENEWSCILTDWDGVEYEATFALLRQEDGSYRVDRCTIKK